MELTKAWDTPNTGPDRLTSIHYAWHDQRFYFQVATYGDGTVRISIMDYATNEFLFHKDIAPNATILPVNVGERPMR